MPRKIMEFAINININYYIININDFLELIPFAIQQSISIRA